MLLCTAGQALWVGRGDTRVQGGRVEQRGEHTGVLQAGMKMAR